MDAFGECKLDAKQKQAQELIQNYLKTAETIRQEWHKLEQYKQTKLNVHIKSVQAAHCLVMLFHGAKHHPALYMPENAHHLQVVQDRGDQFYTFTIQEQLAALLDMIECKKERAAEQVAYAKSQSKPHDTVTERSIQDVTIVQEFFEHYKTSLMNSLQ